MLPKKIGPPLFCGHLQPTKAAVLWHLGGFAVVRAARGGGSRARARKIFRSPAGLGGICTENRTSAHVRSKTKTGNDIGLPPRPPRRLWVRLFAVLGEVGRCNCRSPEEELANFRRCLVCVFAFSLHTTTLPPPEASSASKQQAVTAHHQPRRQPTEDSAAAWSAVCSMHVSIFMGPSLAGLSF